MNVSEYISSGILESYALGELSAQECAKVEAMLSEHSELQAELEQIELTMEALAMGTAVVPPAALKEKVLQSAHEDDTKVVPLSQNESGPMMKYAVAASITIALFTSFLAFNYWNKWKLSEIELSELMAQNRQYADNYNQVNQQLDDLQNAVAIMNNSNYSRVIMSATDNAPGSLATVYWDKNSQDVFLNIQQLKELSEDQQYQLWAIVDGKPVDAGVFDVGNDLLVKMKGIGGNAAAFAVTIEPRGGSESPSLETMQVLGNV